MEKILLPGYVNTYRKNPSPLFVKVKFIDGKLSITGVVGPFKSGNAAGGCGQVYDELLELVTLNSGWDKHKVTGLYEIWRRFHLNDLHAACEHQRAFGWTWASHPRAICPICAYSLGIKWQTEAVPHWVIEYLFKLPESDRIPAWI